MTELLDLTKRGPPGVVPRHVVDGVKRQSSPPRVRLVEESQPKEGSYGSSCKCGLDRSPASAVCGSRRRWGDDHGGGARRRLLRQTASSGSTVGVEARPCATARAGRIARPGGRRRGRAGDPARAGGASRGAARDRLGARGRSLDRARRPASPRPLAARDTAGREEVVRYERARPGELVHVDIKKLGRIMRPGHRVTGDRSQRAKGKAGWQYLYVAIDDHSRLGFAAVHPDETRRLARSPSSPSSSASTARTASRVERVLTDNGTCFKRRWARRLRGSRHHRQEDARPTARRPTARPSASSARCSSAGHTPTPTSTNQSDWLHSPQRSTSTIASVPTAPSEASHRYSASTTSLGHTSRGLM